MKKFRLLVPVDDSYSSSLTNLQGTSYDSVKILWGDNWKMPTEVEFVTILPISTIDKTGEYEKIAWKYTTDDICGFTISGKGDYKDCSIFISCIGTMGNNGYFYYDADMARFWTSIEHIAITYDTLETYEEYAAWGCSLRAILAE